MRIDGREDLEYRKIKIENNIINKAEGSCLVSIGDTKVLAGVKLSIEEPFEDKPNEGILIVNSEFTPLASPEFEPGPPSEEEIELARIVDRGIRESKAIDLENLKIGENKVWGVFIDLHILNHQGNLVDASFLSAVSALLNTKIPKIEDGKILRNEYEKKLPVNHKPIIVTICKYNKKFILDPSLEEEKLISSKLSVCVREDEYICAIQKQGGTFKFEDIEKCLDIAIKKSKELRKYL